MEQENYDSHEVKIIDSSQIFVQETHDKFPTQFIWPKDPSSENATEVLNECVIDLKGFMEHDKEATLHAANLIKESSVKHGFFQVVNHGVDPALLVLADEHGRAFFKLPIAEKLKCKKKDGSMVGFVSAHSGRFSEKLPWKELLSFEYHENDDNEVVAEYFNSTLGSEYKETGLVYQKFCQSMKNLALNLLELLEISLGVDSHNYYKQLYEDSVSLVRCNHYPKCSKPELTYGVGPHCDPITLTILYQDQIGGLEVLVDNKWKAVKPHKDALVINIGDTFQALSNGKYKSCLHRVMVNTEKPRLSVAFFLCPKGDKLLKPHQKLIERDGRQVYPDFKWEELRQFTQKYHRADENTLEEFKQWLLSSKNPMH
uniref:gibberellin 20 oxidase 3-like n=1 Tax=Erigeron canadensis TaxID=72917 RepID=UPI001CB8C88C|nr:gibberellin 20 oxidase 3-like [Erigeron canadensis]